MRLQKAHLPIEDPVSVKKQDDPVVVSVDDDVMKGVRKAQMHIRNEFRDFLRSTLSVLEEDIVENIVRVYDHPLFSRR